MEIEEANKILNPPTPELDEKDHTIAMLKFVIDRMWDKTWDLAFDVSANTEVPEELREKANAFVATDQTALPDDIELEDLQKYAEANNWNEYKKYLDDDHGGDCTSVACTCMRCYVESFYEYDTYPPNKSVGWKAFCVANGLTKEES